MADACGCIWVVGKMKKWISASKHYELASVFCHKMPMAGSQYCPRHDAVAKLKQAAEEEPAHAPNYIEGR